MLTLRQLSRSLRRHQSINFRINFFSASFKNFQFAFLSLIVPFSLFTMIELKFCKLVFILCHLHIFQHIFHQNAEFFTLHNEAKSFKYRNEYFEQLEISVRLNNVADRRSRKNGSEFAQEHSLLTEANEFKRFKFHRRFSSISA